jgi:hypothetical protein
MSSFLKICQVARIEYKYTKAFDEQTVDNHVDVLPIMGLALFGDHIGPIKGRRYNSINYVGNILKDCLSEKATDRV